MSNDLESLEPVDLDKIDEKDLEREVPTSKGLIIKLLIIVICFSISGYIFNRMYLSSPAGSQLKNDEIERLRAEIMVLEEQAKNETGDEKDDTVRAIATLQEGLDKLIEAHSKLPPSPLVNPGNVPVQVEDESTEAVPETEEE